MNTRTLQRYWVSGRFAARYGLAIIVLLAVDLAAAQEQLPIGNPVDVATLPRDLSPWGMYMQADIIVKAVMIGLAIASVVTWTVWLAKTLELRRAKRGARAALDVLLPARSLAEAAGGAPSRRQVVAQLIAAAQSELRESPDLRHEGI